MGWGHVASGVGLVHPGLERDWCLGGRNRDSLRWAEGRARVLLGVVVRMHREDYGTLDTSTESVREGPQGVGEGGVGNTW